MKKQYIQPSMKAYTVKTAEILAGSGITGGSSNKGLNINEAEGKDNNYDDWD